LPEEAVTAGNGRKADVMRLLDPAKQVRLMEKVLSVIPTAYLPNRRVTSLETVQKKIFARRGSVQIKKGRPIGPSSLLDFSTDGGAALADRTLFPKFRSTTHFTGLFVVLVFPQFFLQATSL